uniref:Uncharacterized protein n=1 Tax=Physcomitrium patens TaxID=3218 RepID=A0A7I4E8H0_PHYPA
MRPWGGSGHAGLFNWSNNLSSASGSISLKADERDVYDFFSRAGKCTSLSLLAMRSDLWPSL